MRPTSALRRDPVGSLQPRVFAALDGMRGMAALAIAFRHAPYLWATTSTPTGLLRESYLAVDLFFILSGFVLEHAYRARIAGGLKPLAFMRMRLARLYPLYGLALAIALVCMALTHRLGTGWQLATASAFLPTPSSDPSRPLFPLNYPAWSLFFELGVNLIFVTVGRRLSNAVLCAVVAGSGALLWWSVLGGHFGFLGDLDAGAAWAGFSAGLLRVTFGFFAGVLARRAWRAGSRTIAVRSATLMTCLALVLVCNPPAFCRALFDLTAVTVAFPLLVLLAARNASELTWSRLFRWLGSISYGVYVLQAPVFFAVTALVGGASGAQSTVVGVLAVLLVVGVAHLATVFFDIPVRSMLGGVGKSSGLPGERLGQARRA